MKIRNRDIRYAIKISNQHMKGRCAITICNREHGPQRPPRSEPRAPIDPKTQATKDNNTATEISNIDMQYRYTTEVCNKDMQ